MNPEQIREALIQLIRVANQETLDIAYDILIPGNEERIPLTKEQERLLEQTVKEHREGSPSYTWEEVKAAIKKRE